MREALGRVRGTRAGRVAIGLPTSLARVLTVPLTRHLRAQMPDASISIVEALSTTLQDGLINGRLDVAVPYNAQPAAEIDLLRVGLQTVDGADGADGLSASPLILPHKTGETV